MLQPVEAESGSMIAIRRKIAGNKHKGDCCMLQQSPCMETQYITVYFSMEAVLYINFTSPLSPSAIPLKD